MWGACRYGDHCGQWPASRDGAFNGGTRHTWAPALRSPRAGAFAPRATASATPHTPHSPFALSFPVGPLMVCLLERKFSPSHKIITIDYFGMNLWIKYGINCRQSFSWQETSMYRKILTTRSQLRSRTFMKFLINYNAVVFVCTGYI